MITWWREWRKQRQHAKRLRGVLESCGCACYCPKCKDILNDQAECVDDVERERVYYTCRTCGNKSVWTFDAAPVPIVLVASEFTKETGETQ